MEKTYKTRNKCNEERERKKTNIIRFIYKGKKENTIVKIEKP